MTLPTAGTITNLYLYGAPTAPADLTDASLIRGAGPTSYNIDKTEYMTTGAGRFATGAQNELIKRFFGTEYNIPAGEYTKEQINQYLGSLGYYGLLIDQKNFKDNSDDYADRVYIYNNTSFKISDSARFVVLADGTKKIDGYAIEPLTDNFDFQGGDTLTNIGNIYLKAQIDPSGIGRRVDIQYTGDIQSKTYTASDFNAETARFNS